MKEAPIKLIYIEDHPVMIRGLRDIFRSTRDAVSLSAYAESAEHAIATVHPDQFDLIILDLFLGDADPLMNISRLTGHYPGKPVIIYSGHTGIGLMKLAFEMGIKAWVVKTAEKQEIRETVIRVHHGETIYPQQLLRMQVASVSAKSGKHTSFQQFNPDKEQVLILDLLCEGCTTAEIAAKHLKMTLSNVEKKLQAMRELFEVKTNCEMVILYMRRFGPNR